MLLDGGTEIERRRRQITASLGGVTSFDTDALAIFAAFTTPPATARKALINDLVVGLKDAGIWSLLELFYMLAAADSQAARINWIAPGSYTATAVNSPTFTADRGYTGDGSSARVRTSWTPSLHATKYAQDDASCWVWVLTNVNEAGADIGDENTNGCRIRSRASGLLSVRLNDAGPDTPLAVSDSRGLSGVSRAAAGTKKAWKNGTQAGSDISRASSGVPATEQWMCGANATGFSTKQIALGAWGRALTGLEGTFYTLVSAYLTGVGAI